MYLYLYDSFLNDKKYGSILAKVETRLTDLGVGGKIYRLSPLRNIKEVIADEVRNGVKTIVAVGNDATLTDVINYVTPYTCTVGMIPIGPNNQLAAQLGIPEGEGACAVLAARIVKRLDLGKINTTYFLSGVHVTEGRVTIECEQQYWVTPQEARQSVAIYNFCPQLAGVGGFDCNPEDGILEIVIRPIMNGIFKSFKKESNSSVIPFRQLLIKGQGSTSASVTTDGNRVLKTPVTIEIVPKKLRLIVGKERKF